MHLESLILVTSWVQFWRGHLSMSYLHYSNQLLLKFLCTASCACPQNRFSNIKAFVSILLKDIKKEFVRKGFASKRGGAAVDSVQ